jgi:hypothetical protein
MLAEARDLDYLDLSFDEAPTKRRGSLRAVGDVDREPPARWLADVADVPARLIGDLPVALTLRLRAVDGSAFHVSTSASASAGLREAGAIVLDRGEWESLVLAAEADRAWPADLVRSLRMRGVTGQLAVDDLLDGVTVEQARRDAGSLFSTGRVLARLGARLDAVWLSEATSEGAALP